ncbi:hypothetical protein AAVH_03286 [Aphelenchoides avenae]|nr:hypothetical protein AAVH_03286 [Aphelenchus avenae]
MNVRRQSHTIAVGRGQPLKFTVGVKHLCTHVDLITFYVEDYFGPKKSSLLDNRYGLDFVWRQLGNRFEVHQRNRDASSQVVDLQWPAGKPGAETKANVTVDDRGNVRVHHGGATDSAAICHPGTKDPCSFTRHNYTGDLDAFKLEFVTINDLKCGLFVELDDQNGRLVFHPSGEPKEDTTSPVIDSSTLSTDSRCMRLPFNCSSIPSFLN